MQKIRYRLVYNRKNTLNKQGTALVQVEAKLNQRNIYLTTNLYLSVLPHGFYFYMIVKVNHRGRTDRSSHFR